MGGVWTDEREAAMEKKKKHERKPALLHCVQATRAYLVFEASEDARGTEHPQQLDKPQQPQIPEHLSGRRGRARRRESTRKHVSTLPCLAGSGRTAGRGSDGMRRTLSWLMSSLCISRPTMSKGRMETKSMMNQLEQ